MREEQVEMDGGWKSVKSTKWLTTIGVGTCIAVAITSDECKKAWLNYSSLSGQNTDDLDNMFADAIATHPDGKGLKVWVFGGSTVDLEDKSDVETGRCNVLGEINSWAPSAQCTNSLGKEGNVEVIFKSGAWECSCRDPD
jgi:chemotaxis receptor (MCP) glutamine deamidase CheD